MEVFGGGAAACLSEVVKAQGLEIPAAGIFVSMFSTGTRSLLSQNPSDSGQTPCHKQRKRSEMTLRGDRGRT